ncbi:MAG: 2-dehydropantoate 2-reductase [Proteobacteria bacterium]|nr:2-dehydropantoate 2-reductase [Pseudomonadota bacterium]MBI3495703.1 2-dehydropantoate 2-reductase [Pseudomonadota bacterium]
MKICVYGAGAVGGYVAAQLARAGHRVAVIARGPHLAALQRGGLTLEMAGERHRIEVEAVDSPEAAGPQDLVVLAVKAPAIAAIAGRLRPLLGPKTQIMAAMNGIPWWFFAGFDGPWRGRVLESVDPGGTIGRAIPLERLIGAVIYMATDVPEPGLIRHSIGGRLVIGEPKGGSSPRLEELGKSLSVPGLEVKTTAHVWTEVFLKLAGNVSSNTVSALTHGTAAEMYDHPGVREVLLAVTSETYAVAESLGITLGMSPEKRIETGARLGAFKSSMLQDVEQGRPMEVEAIMGAVKEMALMTGVATPTLDVVLALLSLRDRTLRRG